MENDFTKLRDQFIIENKGQITKHEINTISLMINNLISVPSILEKEIKSDKLLDTSENRKKIENTYKIMNEIVVNKVFIEQIINAENKLKKGKVLNTKIVIDLYKKREK